MTGARKTHVTIPVTVKVTQGRGEIVGDIEVAHGVTRSLDAGNALKWSGATPLRCHGNRGGRSRPQFAEKHVAGRRGIGMLLATQKSYELLANYGFFAREICDKCGIVLGAVRFTRHGESEVYYPRECRVMLKGLRPTGGEGKSQRFSVRISSLEGLLVNRGEFTLISPVGLVKPFLMLMRGKGLEAFPGAER